MGWCRGEGMTTSEKDPLQEVLARFPRRPHLEREDRIKARELAASDPEEAFRFVNEIYSKKTAYARFVDELYPEPADLPTFRRQTMMLVARLLEKGDRDAAVEMLTKEYAETQGQTPDFKPPVKLDVLARSKHFANFPIVQVARDVQAYFFPLTKNEVETWALLFGHKKKEGFKNLTGKFFAEKFFAETGIDRRGVPVQALNEVFKKTFSVYYGVEKKVENRNKKKLAKLKAKKQESRFEPASAYTEEGKLKNPPGINPLIQCVQQFNAFVPIWTYIKENPSHPHIKRLKKIASRYVEIDPAEPLPVFGHNHRINIRPDQPGYIPMWQRHNLNPKRRVRMSEKIRRSYAIPLVITIGEDYVVVDGRALLRNARMRNARGQNVLPKNASLNDLLRLFTKCPIIDTGFRYVKQEDGSYKKEAVTRQMRMKGEKGPKIFKMKPAPPIVTASYVQGVVPVVSVVVKEKGTKKDLTRLLEKGGVGLLSIDLGQINPVAAGIFKVRAEEEELKADPVEFSTQHLDSMLAEIPKYRARIDAMEAGISSLALASLPDEYRAEFEAYKMRPQPEKQQIVKDILCQALGINPCDLPWDRMTSKTTYVSDLLLAQGKVKEGEAVPANCFLHDNGLYIRNEDGAASVPLAAYRTGRKKVKVKGEKGKYVFEYFDFKANDYKWFKEALPKVSKEAEAAWLLKTHELKRGNPDYQACATTAKELCRRVVNLLLRLATSHTEASTVAVVLEDLNLDNRFWSGRGDREPGWANFVEPKSENRWFVQRFHKAFSALAQEKGVPVFLIDPAYTSQTCPGCGHCSKNNRGEGAQRDQFLCGKCGFEGNADKDVAVINIARVALAGARLPGPPKSERSRGKKNPRTARKSP